MPELWLQLAVTLTGCTYDDAESVIRPCVPPGGPITTMPDGGQKELRDILYSEAEQKNQVKSIITCHNYGIFGIFSNKFVFHLKPILLLSI